MPERYAHLSGPHTHPRQMSGADRIRTPWERQFISTREEHRRILTVREMYEREPHRIHTALSPRQRIVVIWWAGLNPARNGVNCAEIARVLGVTPSAVNDTKWRALDRLGVA